MNRTVVLVRSTVGESAVGEYSQDFEELKLGEALALGYLKAFLSQSSERYETVIVNPVTEHLSAARVVERISTLRPFLVGISVTHQWQRDFAFQVSRGVKELLPGTHVVWGGIYPTSAWAELLEMGAGVVDSICRGEGEHTLAALVDSVAAGAEWREVEGLAFYSDRGGVAGTPRSVVPDLGTLPFPDRSDTDAVLRAGGVIQVEASRGCNAGCTFCDMRYTGWRPRPVPHLIDELEMLARQWPGEQVWFIDNIFIGFGKDRHERVVEIADEMVNRGLRIPFSFQDRASNIEEKPLRSLKRAGLNRVYIGIESFSNTALRRWRKGTSAERNKRALRILGEVGIFTQIGFLVFDHGTTMREIFEDIVGLQEVVSYNPYLHLHNFNELIPYHGTYLAREYEQQHERGPDAGETGPWKFTDERIVSMRRWSWTYLHQVWPVTELIFHYFDDPKYQAELPDFLPVKNRLFVGYLEALFSEAQHGGRESALRGLCETAMRTTKRELRAALEQWSGEETRGMLQSAIEAIPERVAQPVV